MREFVQRGLWLSASLLMTMGWMGAAYADGCGQPVEAGRMTLKFPVGGVERIALAYVPTSYMPDERVPAVFDLHGSGSDALEQMDRGMWERTAEMSGFVAVELQGGLAAKPAGWRWNVPGVTGPDGPDDERYISDAIDMVADKLCLDRSRVYASGYSGGARMLSQYVCDVADRFAAVGLVAGVRAGFPKEGDNGPEPDAATCAPRRPVPIIAFSGIKDPINPFAGGGEAYWKYGVSTALARWASINGCQPEPVTRALSATTDLLAYAGCEDGSTLIHYTIKDGGHVWPGSTNYLRQPKLGKVTFEINATDVIWDFFKSHRN